MKGVGKPVFVDGAGATHAGPLSVHLHPESCVRKGSLEMSLKKASGRIVTLFALLVAGAASPAISQAGVSYDGWNYAIDSQNDGSGGSTFEMRGLAFRQSGGTVYFAVSGGMPLGGVPWGGTINNSIASGDLFLNFSSHNLDTAGEFNGAQVFGIRFDGANDSLNNVGGSNTTLGVFANITPASLSPQNSGYGSLQQYYNSGFGAASGAMGDLNTTTDVVNYLGNGAMFPNIGSGTKIGDIALLNEAALGQLGLDFGHFGADPNGNSIFGFSLNAGLLPQGSFMAHLFYECINDGTALFGQTIPDTRIDGSPVPEPSTMTIALSGLAMLVGYRVRNSRKVRSDSAA